MKRYYNTFPLNLLQIEKIGMIHVFALLEDY